MMNRKIVCCNTSSLLTFSVSFIFNFVLKNVRTFLRFGQNIFSYQKLIFSLVRTCTYCTAGINNNNIIILVTMVANSSFVC